MEQGMTAGREHMPGLSDSAKPYMGAASRDQDGSPFAPCRPSPA
jgi:hypothetical protein